jgi:hypothetical protein
MKVNPNLSRSTCQREEEEKESEDEVRNGIFMKKIGFLQSGSLNKERG